jgi:hypothetical protein
MSASSAGALERLAKSAVFGDFRDEHSAKAAAVELLEESLPVDLSVPRRKVVVIAAAIVACVDHPQVSEQLMRHGPQIAGQMGMPGVEADAHLGGLQRAENPQQIPHVPREQMGQHILQRQRHALLPAPLQDVVEHARRIVHAV